MGLQHFHQRITRKLTYVTAKTGNKKAGKLHSLPAIFSGI